MVIKSESGDYFDIPESQTFEYKLYREAVEKGDEETMLKYEGGLTGWKFLDYI